MSQLARIFVVVNLLLAAGFLYAAAMFLGLNEEWKNKHTLVSKEFSDKRTALEREIATQKTRIEELTRESANRKEQADTVKGNLERLQITKTELDTELANKNAQIAKEQANVASANEALQRAQADLAKRTDEANTLRETAQAAQAAERKANEELTAERDKVREKENEIAGLEKEKTTLTGKVDELEIVKRVAQEQGVDVGALMLQPPIPDARVIAVDPGMNLVQVNVGKDQKLSRGAVLDIVRGDRYIGRMKVDQVYAATAAGTMSVTSPGQSPQVGDRATNTLN